MSDLNDRFELVRVITHFENKEFGEVCGIYECKFDNVTRLFIRHNNEVSVVSFFVGESIKNCVSDVTSKIKEVLLYKVDEYLKNAVIK